MDPQVILIGIAAFIVSAVVIYLISALGFKEKSYEEAIAEQKRRNEAEQEKIRKEKKAEKEKKKSKKGKDKSKEKNLPPPPPTTTSEPVIEQDRKRVNLEIEPEIIEPQSSSDLESKAKLKTKKSPKPILHNKDEKSKVSTHVSEALHFKATPKDEVELLHEHAKERKLSGSEKPKKEEKIKVEIKEVKRAQPVEEEIVFVQTQKNLAAAPPTGDRKSKKFVETDVRQLVSSIQNASLNDGEIQTLIDVLLNRQSGSDNAHNIESWNKKGQKGDPVALLRKQLEEKERALQEEQQLAMSSNNKYKELKQEVQREKARSAAMEKQYQDKVAGKDQEFQALQLRMQTAINDNMVDRSAMQARIQQLERQLGDQSRYAKIIEENKVLKENYERIKAEAVPPAEFNSLRQKVSIMENELSSTCSKLNMSDNAKRSLEHKIAKYEDEIKKLKGAEGDSAGVWSKRVDEVNQQLRKTEAEKNNLSKNLQAAEKECSSVKSRLQELEKALSGTDTVSKELEEKLKGAEKQKNSIETSLKTTEKKLAEIEKEKSTIQKEKAELQTELKKIKEEKKIVDDEMKVTKEKLQTKAPAPNGDINDESSGNKITKEEHEKILSEKVTELKKLTSEIDSKKNEISEIQKQLSSQKKEVSTVQEQLKSVKNENSNLKNEVDSKTKELASLKADLQSNKPDTTQITKLKEELEAQKKKNNELREKNWKAMDALDKTEKSCSDKVQKAVKETKEQIQNSVLAVAKSDEALLQRLFPDVKVSEKLSHDEWMSSFQKEVQKYLATSQSQNTSASSDDSSKFKEDNKKLESQVQEFKLVLQTTENKLQQLENSVEGEEKKWQQKLQAIQLDLEQCRQENTTLKGELEKCRGSTEALGELDFAYRCLEKSITKITDEAEVRISTLESELNEKSQISDNLDDLLKQIEELKKSNKELASTNVRLNGIIKTGQDSLSKEQQLVEELRKQVDEKVKKSGGSPSQETEELRKRVSELEKQLDKEVTSNKQMSQKLAQLGVMAASQANDLGTQV